MGRPAPNQRRRPDRQLPRTPHRSHARSCAPPTMCQHDDRAANVRRSLRSELADL